jgi:hypothetical protein
MTDFNHQCIADKQWLLYIPSSKDGVQPFRSAPTAWPISAEELKRTEARAARANVSAINNLGTKALKRVLPQYLFWMFVRVCICVGCAGAIHFFGWGPYAVNRYKAYDCFCRADSAGCAAASLNRSQRTRPRCLCCNRWLSYVCALNRFNRSYSFRLPSLAIRPFSVH